MCVTPKRPGKQRDYIAYIDEQYNSERLTNILTTLTDMIGAKVLNIARQDYDPQGGFRDHFDRRGLHDPGGETRCWATWTRATLRCTPIRSTTRKRCLATFRVDIDVATCGEITPLSTLDYLIGSFDSDIITMDYRVRGFTRDVDGKKLFMDHDVASIQDYIDPEILRRYDAVDINVYEANLFHTKMMIKEIDLQNYLFKTDVYELPPRDPAGDHEQPAAGDDRDFQRPQHLLIRGRPQEGGRMAETCISGKRPDLRGAGAFAKMRVVPFDVPGHKRGRGNPELTELLGEKCVAMDVNSMKPLDNLCHPVSVIREAEELAAQAFGAAHAFLMVGGTTSRGAEP